MHEYRSHGICQMKCQSLWQDQYQNVSGWISGYSSEDVRTFVWLHVRVYVRKREPTYFRTRVRRRCWELSSYCPMVVAGLGFGPSKELLGRWKRRVNPLFHIQEANDSQFVAHKPVPLFLPFWESGCQRFFPLSSLTSRKHGNYTHTHIYIYIYTYIYIHIY